MSSVIPLPGGTYFSSAEIGLERADQVFRSGYTGRRQVVSWPYALWVFTAQTIPLDHAEAGPLRAFLARLKGRVNTWRQPIPGSYNTAGYTGPNGLLNGAHPAGTTTVTTDGWTVSRLILRAGDYCTINDELKIVTADVTSNSSGQAVIPVEPPLRRAAADNATVEAKAPWVMLASSEPTVARWKLSYPTRHTFNFVAVESFQ